MGYISDKYDIPHETVVRMAKDGIVDWRIEYLYEFWTFYNELCQNGTSKMGICGEMMLHYKISKRSYYRWLNVCKQYFANDVAQV